MAGPPLQCGSCVLRKHSTKTRVEDPHDKLIGSAVRNLRRKKIVLAPHPTAHWFLFPAHPRTGSVPVGNRKCASLADIFASVARGFHLRSYAGSSLTTWRRASPSDLRGAFLTLGTFRGSDRAVLPPPSPLAHRRFIELVTRTFHSLAEGHLLSCQPGKGTSEDSL